MRTITHISVWAQRGILFEEAIRNTIFAFLALVIAVSGARAQEIADYVGDWQSGYTATHFVGFNFMISEAGNPAAPLRAVGLAAAQLGTTTECGSLQPDRTWASAMCEAVEKDGTRAVTIDLAADGDGFFGIDQNSDAIFRFARPADQRFGEMSVIVDFVGSGGVNENYVLGYLNRFPAKSQSANYAGFWRGAASGLDIELELTSGSVGLLGEFRYFPANYGGAKGAVTNGLAEVVEKDRSFAMTGTFRPTAGQGRNSAFATPVRHPVEEWQIGHDHFAMVRSLTAGTLELELARTRDDLISGRTQVVIMTRFDGPMRDVAPIPELFSPMTGRWSGASGPLAVELDLEVAENGDLKGEIRHFDDGGEVFPDDVSAGFPWAHEITFKNRPFAASLNGTGERRSRTISGAVETGDQGDISWQTSFRLRPQGDDTLLLDYSVPNQPVAFSGPPIVLTRLDRALREVSQPVAMPPSGLAGLWSFQTGMSGGGSYVLQLDDTQSNLDGRLIAQFVPATTGGKCEPFARTQGICELARDKGPINTAIRLEPTGDTRWTHMGAHGVRAFGGDLPAYTDLRFRVAAGRTPDELLVQMTADDAFGLNPDNTYIFERVADPSKLNLTTGSEQDGKVYMAKETDAIGGGACESWAKEDSLRRQKDDPALTAQLDAILAAQSLSVSGHPMDRQCKDMLDAIGALNGQNAAPAPTPLPAPAPGPDQAGGEGSLWRGSYWIIGDGGSNTPYLSDGWKHLDKAERVTDTLEARVVVAGDQLMLFPANGETRFTFEGKGKTMSYANNYGSDGKTPTSGFTRIGTQFGDGFDSLVLSFNKRLTDASETLRFPYPDGERLVDFVGADSILWQRGKYRLAYLSADGNRLFVYDEASALIHRFLLLEKVEDAPEPAPMPTPELADNSPAGTWTRLGDPIWSALNLDLYQPRPAADGTTSSFEVRATADGHELVLDGTQVSKLFLRDNLASVVSQHLSKAAPQTGGTDVSAWLGTDPAEYMSYRSGGDRLYWGGIADRSEKEVLFLFSGSRAVALIGWRNYGGMQHIELLPTPPTVAAVLLFERTGTPQLPAPNPAPSPTPGPVVNVDPVQPPVPSPDPGNKTTDAGRSAVCVALDVREAELLATATTEIVQLIRSIFVDVGLAFGGDETEAKCQRALDQLAGLALVGPNASAGGSGSGNTVVNIDNSTSIVNTVVGNLNTYVNNGGSWSAPDAPDACGALAPISGGLSLSGGVELSGLLGNLFLSIGFESANRAAPEQCYNALTVLDDLGLDPADADNMASVIEIVNLIIPPQTGSDGRPMVTRGRELSRACEAYFRFMDSLYGKGVPELDAYLASLEASFGDPNGRNSRPTARDCARALRDFVELGLDANLPDGGWSVARVALYGPGPVPQPIPIVNPVVPVNVGGYDPRPEPARETVTWRDEFRYIFPFPELTGAFDGVDPSNLTVFVIPQGGDEHGGQSTPGQSAHCTETEHTLLPNEAMRVWAMVHQLSRDLGIPASITTGRNCILVQSAVNAAFALGNGPTIGNGLPEIVLDRRLDAAELASIQERDVAASTIATLIGEVSQEAPFSWHLMVTTAPIVEAFLSDAGSSPLRAENVVGRKVSPRSAIVFDRSTRRVLADFTIHLGNAD